jgi:hypothetical protein
MFQLPVDEFNFLRSQIMISKSNVGLVSLDPHFSEGITGHSLSLETVFNDFPPKAVKNG